MILILDSGSSSRKGVEVQVLSSAPNKSIVYKEKATPKGGLLFSVAYGVAYPLASPGAAERRFALCAVAQASMSVPTC
jgi:hypothetical protein